MIEKTKGLIYRTGFALWNNIFFVSIVFLLAYGLIFFVTLGRTAVDTLVEQTLHREQLAVRAGALSIDIYLHSLGDSLATVAKAPSVYLLDVSGKEVLTTFLNKWKDTPLIAVVQTDASGVVIEDHNYQNREDVGSSIADREQFIWAKTAKSGDILVTKAVVSRFGATKGQYIFVVATPVFDQNGNFAGVLDGVVLISSLAKEYINPLRISDKSSIYLLKNDGSFIYASDESLIGKNVFQYFDEHPFLGSKAIARIIKDNLQKGQEGKLDTAIPIYSNGQGPLKRQLIAYAPLNLTDSSEKAYLATSTPIDDAMAFLEPIYIKQIGVIIITFLLVLIFSVRVARIYVSRVALQQKKTTDR